MPFCQLSGRQYLRDLEDNFNSKKAHHLPILLGVTYFVGRMKANARYDVIGSRAIQSDRVLSDEVIQLNSDKAKMDCPIPL